jgi:RHS repeat-associated protein
MAYNALDQLLSANRTGTNPSNETYAYDDQGRRISKTSGGLQTNNLYNRDAIHSQWVTSPSNTPTAVMVHGAGIDEPLMRLSGTTNTPNATARFYMSDGLGSVIGQVDENGINAQSQRFDAWGGANNATNASGINTTPPYGFTGREPDGTGLIHYRARNYLPGLGIFTSRDPAGMVDALSPYAYVGNMPTMAVDPTGEVLWTPPVLGAIYGGISGAFGGALTSYAANGQLSDLFKGAALGGAAGFTTGFFAPTLSSQAGALAAAAGLARTVGTVSANAIVGGASNAFGQVAGNLVTSQPLLNNFSVAQAVSSVVAGAVATPLQRVAGNIAGAAVGANVSFGNRSLTIVTPGVQNAASTAGAIVGGGVGAVFEIAGQAVVSSFGSNSTAPTGQSFNELGSGTLGSGYASDPRISNPTSTIRTGK